jgi:hypothetical protein
MLLMLLLLLLMLLLLWPFLSLLGLLLLLLLQLQLCSYNGCITVTVTTAAVCCHCLAAEERGVHHTNSLHVRGNVLAALLYALEQCVTASTDYGL